MVPRLVDASVSFRDYPQGFQFVATDPDLISYRFSQKEWNAEEKKAWVREIGISLRTAQRWFSDASSYAPLVPSFFGKQTRLDTMPLQKPANQIRFVAGMLSDGAILRGQMLQGDPRNTLIECESFAHCASTAWQVITHAEKQFFLGISFTRIEAYREEGKWVLSVDYNDIDIEEEYDKLELDPEAWEFPSDFEFEGRELPDYE